MPTRTFGAFVGLLAVAASASTAWVLGAATPVSAAGLSSGDLVVVNDAATLPASLERLPLPRLAGVLLGGLTALGAGLLICLGVALAAMVYLALNGMAPTISGNLARLPATPGELLTSLTLIVALAPSLAATLWTFSVGAPIQTAQISYTGHGTFHASFAAFGVSTWGGAWMLLALIPILTCLLGGRIAARFIGARLTGGPGAAAAGPLPPSAPLASPSRP
jgi:hypothetical protein